MATNARVLLRCHGDIRRFLKIVFRDGPSGDGTLIAILDREPTGRWDNKLGSFISDAPLIPFRITYHATGAIHFHGISSPHRIFAEPLFAISAPRPLGLISLPSAAALRPFTDRLTSLDGVLTPVPDAGGRMGLSVTLFPDNHEAITGMVLHVQKWFRLAVTPAPTPDLPDVGRADVVWHFTPNQGPFARQLVDRNQALIFVHRKLTGQQGLICYWMPTNKAYRLIFSVPMRDAPRPTIELEDPKLVAVVDEDRASGETCFSELWFRVRGPGGFLPVPVSIRRIELSADL